MSLTYSTVPRDGAGLLLAGGGISLALKIVLESPGEMPQPLHTSSSDGYFWLRNLYLRIPSPSSGIPLHSIILLPCDTPPSNQATTVTTANLCSTQTAGPSDSSMASSPNSHQSRAPSTAHPHGSTNTQRHSDL